MVARGCWISEGQTPDQRLPVDDQDICDRAVFNHIDRWTPKLAGDFPRSKRVAFQLNALISPWVTWSEIIAEFFRVEKNPEELRVFVNSVLGEPWRVAVDEVSEGQLSGKREGALPRDVVPDKARVLIVSADVQKDRIYYVVRAWGTNRTSWLVREGILADLDELVAVSTDEYTKENGSKCVPSYLAIDTGYRTFEVYDTALAHPGVYAVKGQPSQSYPVRESNLEFVPPGRAKSRTVKLYHVDTGYFKEMLYLMAKTVSGEPGALHLNRDVSDDYCQQFTSEHLVWVTSKRKGGRLRQRVWMPKRDGAANHYLDCEVYGLALAYHRRVLQLKEEDGQSSPAPEPQTPAKQWGKPMGWQRRELSSHSKR